MYSGRSETYPADGTPNPTAATTARTTTVRVCEMTILLGRVLRSPSGHRSTQEALGLERDDLDDVLEPGEVGRIASVER